VHPNFKISVRSVVACVGDLVAPLADLAKKANLGAFARLSRWALIPSATTSTPQKWTTAEYLVSQDCLVVATDHSVYDWGFIAEHARLIVASRNATKQVAHKVKNVRKA
jgi:uncharacterized protein with PIN domain